jgi:AcrR family transcriptional regulator
LYRSVQDMAVATGRSNAYYVSSGMKSTQPKAAKGRPRSFDPEKALDAAMRLFWSKGYEGTSLDDLTGAMGINRPSMYAAFGNKESLFRQAVQRYTTRPGCHVQAALQQPTARAVAEHVLRGTAELLTNPRHPRGCLLVQGALACGDDAKSVRATLTAQRNAGEAALRKRFKRAKAEGDLPRDADPADLARYLATITHGMSVQSAGGATRRDLMNIAEIAMRAFPC